MSRFVGVLLLLFSLQATAVDIIVHRKQAGATLSPASVRALFGMHQPTWPDGRPVRLFVLPDTHPAHALLCKEVLNLYPYQLRQYWDRLAYSGLMPLPVEVASEEEMIDRVATTPGALGYVGKVKANASVKVLAVDG
jgi:hypothetical protein